MCGCMKNVVWSHVWVYEDVVWVYEECCVNVCRYRGRCNFTIYTLTQGNPLSIYPHKKHFQLSLKKQIP